MLQQLSFTAKTFQNVLCENFVVSAAAALKCGSERLPKPPNYLKVGLRQLGYIYGEVQNERQRAVGNQANLKERQVKNIFHTRKNSDTK